jgi:hypothetical protein
MIVLARGAGTVFCREWSRSWLVKGMSDLKRKAIMLPLKLAENQASVLNKMSALAHLKYGREILATKS